MKALKNEIRLEITEDEKHLDSDYYRVPDDDRLLELTLGEPGRSAACSEENVMSEQRYEPRLVQFTLNNKERDNFPKATLKRLGLPRSPKALILVEMRAPFQGTVGGRANKRGDRVFLRFNWREVTEPADWDKAEAEWGGGFVDVTSAIVFNNWAPPWVNANMIHLCRIPPRPDEIPAGWSLVHDPMAGPEGCAWLTRPELPNPASGGVADTVVCDCGWWPQLGTHYRVHCRPKESPLEAAAQ